MDLYDQVVVSPDPMAPMFTLVNYSNVALITDGAMVKQLCFNTTW